MIITLSPETETRLRQRADQTGQDYNSLADTLLGDILALDAGSPTDPDALTAEQIGEIRAGIRRGMDAAGEGRIKSLPEAVAEARTRHGFSNSWAGKVDGKT